MKLQKGLVPSLFLLVFATFLTSCGTQSLKEPQKLSSAEKVIFISRPFQNAVQPWANYGGWARLKQFRKSHEDQFPHAIWGVVFAPTDSSKSFGPCSLTKNLKLCEGWSQQLGDWKTENEMKVLLGDQWTQVAAEVLELKAYGVEVLEVRMRSEASKALNFKKHFLDDSAQEDSTLKEQLQNIKEPEKTLNVQVSKEVLRANLRNWSLEALQKMGRVQGIALYKNSISHGFFPGSLTQEQWLLSFPEDDELVGADVSAKQVAQLIKLFSQLNVDTFGSLWNGARGGKVMMTLRLYKDLERRGFRMSLFRFGATLETALKAELKRNPPF